jgi:hypothetical protein
MAGVYWKHNGLSLSTGNVKVKSNQGITLILNMGSASDCPSMKLGLCVVCNMDAAGLPVRCYAKSSEQFMPCTKSYREQQGAYWHAHTATEIIADLDAILSIGKRGSKVKAFRFNEAGDFTSPVCIEKANAIATYLREKWNIKKIWTYTARQDLAPHLVNLSFTVKGSGWNAPNGQTIVVCGKETVLPKGYRECPGDCSICSLCAVKGVNIAFRSHGGKTNINKPMDAAKGAEILKEFYGLVV